MEIITILSSFNKISLIAFIVTFGFIIYEIYLFKKETTKKGKPNIPDFKDNIQVNPGAISAKVNIVKGKEGAVIKPSRMPLIIGIIFLIIFGLITVIGFLNPQSPISSIGNKKNAISVTPVVSFMASKGIKIYSKDWQELNEQELTMLKLNDQIYIGVETVRDTDIDRARIRVNKDSWKTEDITLDFDIAKKIFYKEYIISTEESSLKIEAQLHSKIDGWLGD